MISRDKEIRNDNDFKSSGQQQMTKSISATYLISNISRTVHEVEAPLHFTVYQVVQFSNSLI